MSVRLETLAACFRGVIPAIIATCSADGEPNVTYLSQVYYVDTRHVALSCQFFNKTRRNVDENPYATVLVHHPVSFELWQLRLRFQRAEVEGLLFDRMAARIQVIATHTGMAGVFRLLSADVYDVLSVELVEGFLEPADPLLDPLQPIPAGPLTELRGVQLVSERIARSTDLEHLLGSALEALDEILGFSHSMVLVPDESGQRLVTIATRGYGSKSGTASGRGRQRMTTVGEGIGAEVVLGEGTIGTAAQHRTMIRVTGVDSELRYGRAIRERVTECGGAAGLMPEIPLPGLPDAQAQLALPLLVGDRLVGALAVESRDPLGFDEWDEAFLQILANQIALGVDRLQDQEEDQEEGQEEDQEGDQEAGGSDEEATGGGPEARSSMPTAGRDPAAAGPPAHSFVYYGTDDCVFVDGDYLIRNVPGRILWKLLRAHQEQGQTEFTNRELRLDPSLGLPPIKDNLESRLILLRKRLVAKCHGIRIVPVRRGRFALEIDGPVEIQEKEYT